MTDLPFPRRPRPTDPVFLSAKALADRWDMHIETIYRTPASELPYHKIRGQRRYALADVEAYEEAAKVVA